MILLRLTNLLLKNIKSNLMIMCIVSLGLQKFPLLASMLILYMVLSSYPYKEQDVLDNKNKTRGS